MKLKKIIARTIGIPLGLILFVILFIIGNPIIGSILSIIVIWSSVSIGTDEEEVEK